MHWMKTASAWKHTSTLKLWNRLSPKSIDRPQVAAPARHLIPVQKDGKVKVWDLPIRLLHWGLAFGFAAAYFSYDIPGPWHEWLGYVVLSMVFIRLILGFAGSHYSRFSQFVRSPSQVRNYIHLVQRRRQPRYLGHNPLGGIMTLALLLMVALTCASGWLYTTDRFWGVAWVENLHAGLTWVTIAMISLHIVGVVVSSAHDHENLVTSMIHGYKRPLSGEEEGSNANGAKD